MSKRKLKLIDDEADLADDEFSEPEEVHLDDAEDDKFIECKLGLLRNGRPHKVWMKNIGGWMFTGAGTADDPYEFLDDEEAQNFFDDYNFFLDQEEEAAEQKIN